MSESNITKRSASALRKGKTDAGHLRQLSDAQISQAVADDADAAPLDMDWSKATVVVPAKKQSISIRLDEDVIAFFKGMGSGYQTKINAVLRSFMQHKN
jgi:uncharacterized protein (DUF4415 family)